MSLIGRKIAAFAKKVADLADKPNLGSSALLKQQFDSSPEELRVAFNGAIDDLTSVSPGSSGAENLGSAPIAGVTGATPYAQIVDLKAQIGAVVLGQIPDGSLTTAKYQDGSITTSKLATGVVTLAKVNNNLKNMIRMGGMF